MKPLRLAIIGVGHLGRIHARLSKNVPGVELVGVCDPLEANRRAVAAEQGTTAYADHRELLGHIDAAVLATPTRYHHAVGMELLERGVHLLIEKPIAPTLAEADDLVRAARTSGSVLQVGHVERFNPVLTAALPHLREPKYIEASRLGGFTGRSTDIGVVLDLMIHDIDLVLWLARSPLRHVEALGVSVLGGHEDTAHARLVFENGCVATLNASRVSYQPARTMQVWSASGFASLDFATRTATLVRLAEDVARRTFQVEDLSPEQRATLKDKLFEHYLPKQQLQAEPVDAITAELTDFADSIRTGRAPRVTGEQGRDAIAVAEQVLRKIQTHLWDGHVGGRTGPQALPTPSIIPAPHWDRLPRSVPLPGERREAG